MSQVVTGPARAELRNAQLARSLCAGKDIIKAPADVAGQPLSGSPRTTARVSEKVAVSVVFVAAMFMSIMDTTIVNVALPTIGRDFSVSSTAVDSVSIAFLVAIIWLFVAAVVLVGPAFALLYYLQGRSLLHAEGAEIALAGVPGNGTRPPAGPPGPQPTSGSPGSGLRAAVLGLVVVDALVRALARRRGR